MEALEFLKVRYESLTESLALRSVNLHPFGANIKDNLIIGKRIDNHRALFSQVRFAIERNTKYKRAVKSYSLKEIVLDSGVLRFADKPGLELDRIFSEITALSGLTHPNIVKIYEVYCDHKFLHIVTELCQGGELFDLVFREHNLNEERSFRFISQILEALRYMNSMSYCHRALCLENIMLDHSLKKVKLIGFSCSSVYDSSKMSAKFGSPMYMAPEMFRGSYTNSCDIWSVGVIFFALISGTLPFVGDSLPLLIANVRRGRYWKNNAWKMMNSNTRKFLTMALKKKSRAAVFDLLSLPFVRVHLVKNSRLDLTLRRGRSRIISETNSKLILSAHIKHAILQIARRNKHIEIPPSIEHAWKNLDYKNSGVLNESSFEKLYEVASKICPTTEVPINIRKCASLSYHGLGKNEFISVFIKICNEKTISECFDIIDTLKKGTINANDLQPFCPNDDIESLVRNTYRKSELTKEEVISLVGSN